MTTLYNANPRSAYRAGFYTGTQRIDELLSRGDFGLGALDRNDGELVVLDGRAYRTDFDGTTHELPASATTPYATILPFASSTTTVDLTVLHHTNFERRIAEWLPLDNRIWALRIHGRFSLVEAGAGRPQDPPYRPMAQVMPEYNWLRHRDTTGTLVAFSCPSFLLGHNYVGLHYHWLSDDRTQGGHIIDFVTEEVTVEAVEATGYALDVAADPRLRSLDLSPTN